MTGVQVFEGDGSERWHDVVDRNRELHASLKIQEESIAKQREELADRERNVYEREVLVAARELGVLPKDGLRTQGGIYLPKGCTPDMVYQPIDGVGVGIADRIAMSERYFGKMEEPEIPVIDIDIESVEIRCAKRVLNLVFPPEEAPP